jgi:hypothetical protein
VTRRSTSGAADWAAWTCRRRAACASSRRRTPSSRSCWRRRCSISSRSRWWLGETVSPQARREAVTALRAKTGISERRACVLIGLSRTVLHYEQRRCGRREALRGRVVSLAAQRRRFGYRRIHALLRARGRARQRQVRASAVPRGASAGAAAIDAARVLPLSVGRSSSPTVRTRCGRWTS